MVKGKDSFFIRERVLCGTSFGEVPIDLGAFVDALGESILRIHNVSIKYEGDTSPFLSPLGSGGRRSSAWQLTTQTQSAMVSGTNKSIVSTGRFRETQDAGEQETAFETMDINPQMWTNGYLVAVDTIYLGGIGSAGGSATANNYAAITIEASVEKLNKNAALALALSQQ